MKMFCREMIESERKDYCQGNIEGNMDYIDYNNKTFPGFPNHVYYNKDCFQLKTIEECKEETPDTVESIFKYKIDAIDKCDR